MRRALLIVAACSSSPKPGFPNIPVEQEPRPDSGIGEPVALPFAPIQPTEPAPDTFKPGGVPATSIPAAACIPAGTYHVTVDLSTARLSQEKTGMQDLTWCKSLLQAVPATAMSKLAIAVADGQMTVEWPPGKPSTIVTTGACSFGVTSLPMLATITFANGKGSGRTSYQVGTTNHPGESCSAVGAKLSLDRAP